MSTSLHARIASGFAALAALLLSAGQPARAADAGTDLAGRIAAYAHDLSGKGAFSGVVLLSHDGSTVYAGAFGMASVEYAVANTVDTAFNLGSIDKIFTRVAIEQLVEAHKLRYDQTIGDLLPDYPNKAARAVTVQELVDMRSGIGDFFGPQFRATPKDRIRTLADYVPLFAKTPLAFAPGTQQAYSNGGYIVLGLIIEHVSGHPYYDYVADHIFKPAGMTAASWPERDVPAQRLATGYTTVFDPSSAPRNNMYTAPARGSSAGGGYATAGDLVAFAHALTTDRLLAAGEAARLFGPEIGVAGGAPGINADLEIDRTSGYVLVVLSNLDPPAAETVAKTIRGWIGLSG